MSTYKIVKVQYPIVGVAGHNFVVMLDDQNRVVSELQGLATKEQCDEYGNYREKPIGFLLSDRLKAYNMNTKYMYEPHYLQQIVFEGTKAEVEAKWQLGQMALVDINQQDLHYPLVGVIDVKESPLNGPENSNSVASTVLKAMGLSDPDLSWRLTPGEGKQLISDEKLQQFQNNPVAPTDKEMLQNLCVPQNDVGSQSSHTDGTQPVSAAQDMANRLLAMYTGQTNETLSSIVNNHEYTQQRNTEVAQLIEQQKQAQQAQELAQAQIVEEPSRAIRRI